MILLLVNQSFDRPQRLSPLLRGNLENDGVLGGNQFAEIGIGFGGQGGIYSVRARLENQVGLRAANTHRVLVHKLDDSGSGQVQGVFEFGGQRVVAANHGQNHAVRAHDLVPLRPEPGVVCFHE